MNQTTDPQIVHCPQCGAANRVPAERVGSGAKCGKCGAPLKTDDLFTPQAMDRLIRYAWPGNVRELMNAVERAVVMTRSDFLSEEDVSLIPAAAMPEQPPAAGARPLEEVEKAAILTTLKAADGNKSEAARRLGITRRTLHKKLKAYGVMK